MLGFTKSGKVVKDHTDNSHIGIIPEPLQSVVVKARTPSAIRKNRPSAP